MAGRQRTRRRSIEVAGQRARREKLLRELQAPQQYLRHIGDDGSVTVQLLVHHLAAGEIPPVAVGGELRLAPTVYAETHRATGGSDRWTYDQFGTFSARGSVVRGAGTEDAGGGVDVFAVFDHLLPLNWAASGTAEGRIDLEGALYLEPDLLPGAEFGDAVSLCHRRFRLEEVRRYRRRSDGVPMAPIVVPGVPTPAEVLEEHVYVADLAAVLVEDADPRLG